jgi:hypothetical protein
MTLATREVPITQTREAIQAPAADIVVFCPKCKALQTVQISGTRLLPTRKFFQQGPYIYHDCGSNLPCRIYTKI